jgi:hypothetical protein
MVFTSVAELAATGSRFTRLFHTFVDGKNGQLDVGGGTPVRTGRFMASRLIALVEHPAHEGREAKVEVQTRRRLTTAGEE